MPQQRFQKFPSMFCVVLCCESIITSLCRAALLQEENQYILFKRLLLTLPACLKSSGVFLKSFV